MWLLKTEAELYRIKHVFSEGFFFSNEFTCTQALVPNTICTCVNKTKCTINKFFTFNQTNKTSYNELKKIGGVYKFEC